MLDSLTVGRLLIGTPAYTSPEQAECNTADERSDIFSFGAVLYEMLSGRRVFPGTSTASVLGAILHRPPDRLDAPPQLSGIVSKCLEKTPGQHYQSASELLAALREANLSDQAATRGQTRRWGAGIAIACGLVVAAALGVWLWKRSHGHKEALQDKNSIAVLPLEMQSKDADAGYISDGIAASITNSLAKLSVFRVIPNSVTAQFQGNASDFQQIGQTLGVNTVLSGRVVQRGEELFISVELDDVSSGKQLWGQQYARNMSDMLEVQNDIARGVSQKLRSQLTEAERQKMSLGSTTNPEAYQLYLKGSYYTDKFTKDGFNKGINYLNQAVALDPNYSQAYGVQLITTSIRTTGSSIPKKQPQRPGRRR